MDILKHMERAQEAVLKKNFDYAIALYHQVLTMKPDNGQARSELMQALAKKGEYRSAPPLARKAAAFPQYLSILFARITKNKDALIRSCERYLQADPNNLSVNMLLGESLEKAGYLNSAVAVFEYIGDLDKKNTEALKKAGLIKYRSRDIQGALELYERVLAINPRDADAEKMRKNLAAEGTLSSGAYATARSSRELIKEKDEAAHLQRKTRLHMTGDEIEEGIAHQRKALSKSPGDKRVLRELGELYLKKKDFAAASGLYREMLEKEPDSFDLKSILGDIEIREYEGEIEKLEARLKEEENRSLLDDLDALKKELLAKQIEEYAWRVKEHPTDLGLWFEYGQYVFRSHQVDEAIEAFQHAVKDPRHRIQALHMLGKAFMIKGHFDLAEKQLKGALDAQGGVTEKSKMVCYDLGLSAEKKGDPEGAVSWYLKIFEIDINYKDVADKIARLKKTAESKE